MGKRPVIIPTVAIAVVAVGAMTIPAFADDGGGDAPSGNGDCRPPPVPRRVSHRRRSPRSSVTSA